MEEKEALKTEKKYVYVKDSQGVEYICRLADLKSPDELSEEEKAACMAPQGDA